MEAVLAIIIGTPICIIWIIRIRISTRREEEHLVFDERPTKR